MDDLTLKHKTENEANKRSWSRVCSLMGTGFQLLDEPIETRVLMLSDWMDNLQKESHAKSIAKQIQFETEIETAIAESQEKDQKIEELQECLNSLKNSEESHQAKEKVLEEQHVKLNEKFELVRQ